MTTQNNTKQHKTTHDNARQRMTTQNKLPHTHLNRTQTVRFKRSSKHCIQGLMEYVHSQGRHLELGSMDQRFVWQ